MYPSPFAYHRPAGVAEAVALLRAANGDARCLAGGQSLIPAMKFRLSQPGQLVDLSGIAALRGISLAQGQVSIGAMSTHREVESSPVLAAQLPYLARVAGHIADPQVRNRGTIGGSLANADPAADYPASLLALGGTVEVEGPDGPREIAADDWALSLMSTALAEGEIVTRIRFPLPVPGQGAAYVKVPHPASRFAVVGIAAVLVLDAQGVCTGARIASTGIGETARRAPATEALLVGEAVDADRIARAAARFAAEVEVMEDGLLGEQAKRQLGRMTLRKALRDAAARAVAATTSPRPA